MSQGLKPAVCGIGLVCFGYLYNIIDMRFRKLTLSALGLLLLGICLPATAEPDAAYIVLPGELLNDLSSDDFEIREKAYAGLQNWSEKNITASPELLYKAWKQSDDPETQTRCYNLMKQKVIQRKYGKGKGFLGIQMSGVLLPAKPNEAVARQAVRVDMVLPDTPAQKFGLEAGDMIFRVDHVDLGVANGGGNQRLNGFELQLPSVSNFSKYIKSKQPGEVVTLHLLRGGKPREIEVALMKLAADKDPDHGRLENESLEFFNEWFEKMKRK